VWKQLKAQGNSVAEPVNIFLGHLGNDRSVAAVWTVNIFIQILGNKEVRTCAPDPKTRVVLPYQQISSLQHEFRRIIARKQIQRES
jgi:hypothetical protein